jgi:tripartite-type tricarboxylate transporter receptor subunit TctC
MKAIRSIAVFLALLAGSGAALAQAYPAKPVRIIIPVAPGGGAELLARLMAQKLGDHYKQSFYVENITGASSLIGAQAAIRAVPDGHTLFVTAGNGYNISVIAGDGSVDPRKGLAPVAQFTSQPLVMSVNVNLPIHSFQDLVAYSKKNPDGMNFASAGIGSAIHLVGELVNLRAGLKMVNVPYKGIGPGIADVIAGRVQMVMASPSATGAHARAGKLRPIAVTSPTRTPGLPDIPTLAEQGLPGFAYVSWFGMLATAGTPQPVILNLNRAVNQALASPEAQKMFAADGSDPAPGTPEQFKAVIDQVLEDALRVVKTLNIKL